MPSSRPNPSRAPRRLVGCLLCAVLLHLFALLSAGCAARNGAAVEPTLPAEERQSATDAPSPAPAPAPAPAEVDPEAVARARRLIDAALERGRAHDLLASLTETAPARLSGSANYERAVEWGLRTLRDLGFEDVRREAVTVPHWVRGDVESCARLDGDGAVVEQYDVLALGGSVATPPGGVTAEVVMVRSFEELQELGGAAAGRIVFFNRPMPRALRSTFMAYGQAVPQRTSGAVEAARVGGALALVRSMTTARDDHPHTGAMIYQDGVEQVPAVAISTVDADDLAARLKRGETVRLRVELSCETLPDVPSANVVGEWGGGAPGDALGSELIVLGGHLDSWDVGSGAHDDGAGCVHAIEAVRLLMELGMQPRRRLRVVLFANEENGLRGARAYAAAHRDEVHFAAIESDRGGFAPQGFTTTARGADFDRLARALDALDAESAASRGMGALLPGGGGADIGPLREQGAMLFGLATLAHRYFDYHHSAADVLAAVDDRELQLGAAAMAYLASVLADL